jgi:hypothetical protein
MKTFKSSLLSSLLLYSCFGLAAGACQGVTDPDDAPAPPQGNLPSPSVPGIPGTTPSDPATPRTPGAPDVPVFDGTVAVTLHANHASAIGRSIVTSFGVPFPRGLVGDVSKLVVRDADGRELPSHVQPTVTWRTLGGSRPSDGSVRAALVYVEVEFTQDSPIQLALDYDGERTLELGPQPAASANWVEVQDDDFGIALKEPLIYATLSPEWLAQCELRTMTTPAHSDPSWSWFDEFFVNSAYTATNDVPDTITQRIEFEDNEPWLFDRTLTLFGVYARTGDVRWLRHAHRSARFYVAHLTDQGFFEYKDGDLKYLYGASLLVDMMLTGDVSMLETIDRFAELELEWNPVYTMSTPFWTERHQTYALLNALVAWEATGAPAQAERATEIARASFALAADPPGSWPSDGCMLHTMRAHEGDAIDQPICSPWMNGLFADTMWRYYRHSLDEEALVFLANLGNFVAEHGLYDGSDEDVDFLVPYYLVSSIYQYSDSGAWGDLEHTCDVANVVARGAWAAAELGDDPSRLIDTTLELLAGCQYVLDYWHRPNGVSSGLAEWRLSPARKFNWWFGSTLDMPWILASLGVSPPAP